MDGGTSVSNVAGIWHHPDGDCCIVFPLGRASHAEFPVGLTVAPCVRGDVIGIRCAGATVYDAADVGFDRKPGFTPPGAPAAEPKVETWRDRKPLL